MRRKLNVCLSHRYFIMFVRCIQFMSLTAKACRFLVKFLFFSFAACYEMALGCYVSQIVLCSDARQWTDLSKTLYVVTIGINEQIYCQFYFHYELIPSIPSIPAGFIGSVIIMWLSTRIFVFQSLWFMCYGLVCSLLLADTPSFWAFVLGIEASIYPPR